MDDRLYPQGSGGLHSRYVAGVLTFYNRLGQIVYTINPATRTLAVPTGSTLSVAGSYNLIGTADVLSVGKVGAINTFDSLAADYSAIQSYLNVTETGTDAADVKNIRVQLTSAEALTGKYLKSIYSRVDVLHAVVDAYCFQGSMRVGPDGAPSGTVYGLSQSMVLTMTAHTQVTEARNVYASISGTKGINGVATVYMGVVSNTDTAHPITGIYEGNVAAFCKSTSIFAATGEGSFDQVVNVANANGTPAFARFAADSVANCIVAGGAQKATVASGQWRQIKMLVGATAYYVPACSEKWTDAA